MNRGFFISFFFSILFISGCNGYEDAGPVVNLVGTPYELEIPGSLPPMDIPADNPLTKDGVALGRKLFYDPILSADSTQSCGSCHNQEYGFTDNGEQFSEGIDGLKGNMNAMAIINLGWGTDFFWDGRSEGLETQAFEPVINPIEMHDDWDNVVQKLQTHPEYPELFEKAFGTLLINSDLATKAIAQFERTLISGNSAFDRFRAGTSTAAEFGQAEFNGYQIFRTERGDCFHCHIDGMFTDYKFHNNGLDSLYTEDNWGRYDVTGDPKDIGLFRVPTLRNIEKTGPYMHDGRFSTLEEVVEFYNSGVKKTPTVDVIMTKASKEFGLQLSAQEKSDLLAFLKSLTDDEFLTNPAFSDPNQ